jgi:hypothetical protein
MMIAVALLALGLGVTVWGLRRSRLASHYAFKAEENGQKEYVSQFIYTDALAALHDLDERRRAQSDQHFALTGERREFWQKDATAMREHLAQLLRRVEYYSSMKRKYERAARYPWLSVAADPPEPN